MSKRPKKLHDQACTELVEVSPRAIFPHQALSLTIPQHQHLHKCKPPRDFEAKGSRKINPKILTSIFDRLEGR